jgi:hypothetical protein
VPAPNFQLRDDEKTGGQQHFRKLETHTDVVESMP